MNVAICTIGIGGWYPRGVARMIQQFHEKSNGFDILAWVNTLPPLAPQNVVVDGYDYTAYCAKPFALLHAHHSGYDAGILLDAAFWPIRHIQPLVDHIAGNGYYFCDNGNVVGEWCADHALGSLHISRDEAMQTRELSTYCVGLSFKDSRALTFLEQWCAIAEDRVTFPGHHTAGESGRNPGFVSADPRVKGHRHDQTAASVIAKRLGMTNLTPRPVYTAYKGSEDRRTVLVNRGGM